MSPAVHLSLYSISVTALHYIRLIFALVFLPRIPLQTRNPSFARNSFGRCSAIRSASDSSWSNYDSSVEWPIRVLMPRSVADARQSRYFAPHTTKTPHARQGNQRPLLSERPDSNIDFSIYADASSPNLNKSNLIAPMAPDHLSGAIEDLRVLRAASDRVSEILRESRRRLDAGEDSSTIRREARRKRAQELLSARNQGANFPR